MRFEAVTQPPAEIRHHLHFKFQYLIVLQYARLKVADAGFDPRPWSVRSGRFQVGDGSRSPAQLEQFGGEHVRQRCLEAGQALLHGWRRRIR